MDEQFENHPPGDSYDQAGGEYDAQPEVSPNEVREPIPEAASSWSERFEQEPAHL
jgi:hypothetical protein